MRDKVYSYRKVTEREKECIQRYVVEIMKPVRFGRIRVLVNNLDNAQEVTTILETREEIASYVYDLLTVFNNMEFKVTSIIVAVQQYNKVTICILDISGVPKEMEILSILEKVVKIQSPLSKGEVSTENLGIAYIALRG